MKLTYSQIKQMKMNGLHSGTVIRERAIQPGMKREWHEHPETGEIIVMDTWVVADGEDVQFESEVVQVIPKSKHLAELVRGLENLYQQLSKV